MKRCSSCGLDKPLDDFHRDGRPGRDGRQVWCKGCRKEYDRLYHASTRVLRLEQKRAWKAGRVAWGWTLKEGRPCADCGGVFHPVAMQWDHRPGTQKRGEISRMVDRASRKDLLSEIEKCDLVCANCHAVRTYERRRDVAQPG